MKILLVPVVVLVILLWFVGGECFARGERTQRRFYKAEDHGVRYGTSLVHYATVGKKGAPAVLFVHGWGCNGNFWREQVPALGDMAQLILVDLPGHGQSEKPTTEYSLDYFAGAVVAVLRDARVKQAILVGHSMGAPVICRVYAQSPASVAAVVAIDGMLRRPQMPPEQAEKLVGNFRSPAYRDQVKLFVASMFPNPRMEALRDRVLSDMLGTPQFVLVSAMEGMFDSHKPAWDLPKLDVPVLVINARNPMWTAEYEAYVGSLSARTSYHTIDGAGHFVMLEKPTEFNAILIQTLQQFALLAK